MRAYRTLLDRLRAPGGILFTCSHPQLPGPLRHTLNIRVHWCSLVSASLGWIRAQLWGPHPPGPGPAKFRLPRGRAAPAGRDYGVQREESEQEAGVPGAAAISLVLTGPARGPAHCLGEAQKRPGPG